MRDREMAAMVAHRSDMSPIVFDELEWPSTLVCLLQTFKRYLIVHKCSTWALQLTRDLFAISEFYILYLYLAYFVSSTQCYNTEHVRRAVPYVVLRCVAW